MNFRYRLMQFLSGRYGQDKLFLILFGTAVALSFVNLFFRSIYLQLAVYIIVIYALFRFFSRNIEARRRENQWVMDKIGFISRRRKLAQQRKADKCHIYRKCPFCAATLRLPHRIGTHKTVCPKCGKEFTVKVRK